MKRYDPSYLAGWFSEEYSVDKEAALAACQGEFSRQERAAVADFLPGDTSKGLALETQFGDINSDLVLLPVYLLSYRYGEKLFRIAINGQTGRIAGGKPISVRSGCNRDFSRPRGNGLAVDILGVARAEMMPARRAASMATADARQRCPSVNLHWPYIPQLVRTHAVGRHQVCYLRSDARRGGSVLCELRHGGPDSRRRPTTAGAARNAQFHLQGMRRVDELRRLGRNAPLPVLRIG